MNIVAFSLLNRNNFLPAKENFSFTFYFTDIFQRHQKIYMKWKSKKYKIWKNLKCTVSSQKKSNAVCFVNVQCNFVTFHHSFWYFISTFLIAAKAFAIGLSRRVLKRILFVYICSPDPNLHSYLCVYYFLLTVPSPHVAFHYLTCKYTVVRRGSWFV